MIYEKISAVTEPVKSLQSYYSELGMEPGTIPSEDEFSKSVQKYYKSIYRKKDFNPSTFREVVETVYKDISDKVKSEKDGEPSGKKTHDKLDRLGAQLGMLDTLLGERHSLLRDIEAGPEKVLQVLKEEDMKRELEDKDPRKTNVKYTMGDTIHVDRDLSILNAIKALEAGKDSPGYSRALSTARSVLQKGIREIDHEITKVKGAISKYISEFGKPDKDIERKPVYISPFTDVQNTMMMMETDYPVGKQGASDSMWLHNPGYLKSLFKVLTEKEPERKTLHYTDIFEVQPDVKELVDRLYNFTGKINKMILEMSGFLKDEEHLLATLPREKYEGYKGYRDTLKKKYPENEFNQLTQWDVQQNDFKYPISKLPSVLHDDRDKLDKFFSQVNKVRVRNSGLMENEWNNLNKWLGELKADMSALHNIFNKVNRETYFKQWLKGDVPVQMRPKSSGYGVVAKYKDPGDGLKSIKEKIGKLEDFLKSHELWTVASKDKVVEVLRSGSAEDYMDVVKSFISGIKGAMDRYAEGMDSFLTGLFTGSSLEDKASKESSSWYMRRIAMSMILADIEDEDIRIAMLKPSEMKEIQEYSEKRIKDLNEGKTWDHVPKIDPENRSEYLSTRHLGLVFDPSHPKGIILDFFQKSFPIEEILNEWFKQSGGKHLDPKIFPKVVDQLQGYLEDSIKKSMSSGELQKEKKRYEDELEKTIDRIKGYSKEIRDAESWATSTFHEFDKKIQESEAIDSARKEKVRDLFEKSKELGKKWDASIEERPFDKVRVLKLRDEYMDALRGMDRVIEDFGKGSSPFMKGQKEFIETMKEKAARVWNSLGAVTVKAMNNIEKLEDKDIDLQNHINRLTNMLKEGPSEKQKGWFRKNFITELWNILDTNWMRKIKEFQGHYNLNFDDYMSIHSEVEKLVGSKVHSRAYARLKDELKKEIRFLRDKGKPIPKSLYEAIQKLWSRGELTEEKKEVGEMMGEEPKSVPVPSTVKEASLYDYPTEMSYRVASGSIGSVELSEMELLLR